MNGLIVMAAGDGTILGVLGFPKNPARTQSSCVETATDTPSQLFTELLAIIFVVTCSVVLSVVVVVAP